MNMASSQAKKSDKFIQQSKQDFIHDEAGMSKAPDDLSTPQAPDPTPIHLLRLPMEVRRQIYLYIIPRKLIVDVNEVSLAIARAKNPPPPPPPRRYVRGCQINYPNLPDPVVDITKSDDDSKKTNPTFKYSILLVCRPISNDVLTVLYGENTFVFSLYEPTGEKLAEQLLVGVNRKRISHAVVTIDHERGPTGERFDDEFWSMLLPGLVSLQIVVNHVAQRRGRSEAEVEMEMDRWLNWLLVVFRRFAGYLSRETKIRVEVLIGNGRLEIEDLLWQYLPEGQRMSKELNLKECLR